ncbi:MAG: UbiA family prenyltransferase [Candidatus Odinarchaeota archaeon]
MQRFSEYSVIKSLIGIVELGRPVDGVVIGSAVILGMFVSSTTLLPADKYVSGFLMGFILLAAMDTFNDYKDREVDKISKPQRPIPRGLPPRLALFTAVLETLVGLLIALLLGLVVVAIVFIAIFIAIAYSKWLKPYFLMKNVVVAIGLSMAMIAGVFISSGSLTGEVSFLLVLIFIVAFCFEIHKDLGDIVGDSSHGIRTIPVVLGVKRTVIIIIAGYTLSWLLTCFFFILKVQEVLYAVVLILTALAGFYVVYLFYEDPLKYLERSRRVVTATIGILILAIISLY